MVMRYATVCSGIGAPEVAWQGLGWDLRWQSEIDRFPSAVLAHHWPDVPNLGDMTKATTHERFEPVDLLIGGTPCQSFSIAGKRLGLDDPRGGLALAYLRLARDCGARWVVFENVPGLLSSDGGRDMGAFVGLLGELGYGCAWRVLDAVHFGVPQSRRRVFIVGCAGGDWRRAAAVLFEPESLRGNRAPGRDKREDTAPCVDASIDRKWGSNQWVDAGQWVVAGPSARTLLAESGQRNNAATSNFALSAGREMVRRFTPRECERLQGFPDDHTRIPYRNKPADKCPDGPRYKAIGNSMAVPVLAHLGQRIAKEYARP